MADKKELHGLVDGDLLVFSCCAAAEYKHKEGSLDEYDDDEMLMLLPQILKVVDRKLEYFSTRLGLTDMTVFFSGKENYRFHVMPEYKANRATVWRPVNLKIAIAETARKWKSQITAGLEADDLMAHHQDPKGSTVIITLDKDLLQSRGKHFRWETEHQGEKWLMVEGNGHLRVDVTCKDCGTTTEVHASNYPASTKVCENCNADLRYSDTKAGKKNAKKDVKGDGPLWFLYQCLIGDPTDGIMGCGILEDKVYKSGQKAGLKYSKRTGIGSFKAYELLMHSLTYGKALDVVKAEYVKRFGGGWVLELLKQGRCLYMVKNINAEGHFQMWHYDSSVKEFYDPVEKEIYGLPIEGE